MACFACPCVARGERCYGLCGNSVARRESCPHLHQRGKGDWMVCDDCGAQLAPRAKSIHVAPTADGKWAVKAVY